MTRHFLSRVAAPVGALGLAGAGMLPGLFAGPSFDAAVFGTIGWLASRGRIPYSQAWDHKPPVIYLLEWPLQAVTGGVGWWPWMVVASVSATAAAGLMVGAALATRLRSRRIAVVVGCLTAGMMAQYPLALGGGLTETFALPLLAGALLLVCRSLTSLALAAAGACLALALTASVQSIPGAVAIAVSLVLLGGWRCLPWLILGGAVVAIIGASVLVLLGAGPDAVDALLRYSQAYRGSSTLGAAQPATGVLVLLVVIIPAMLGVIRIPRLTPASRRLGWAMVAWVVLSLLVFLSVGRFELHYAIPLVIPLAILAGYAVDLAARPVDRLFLATLTGLGFALSLVISSNATGVLAASVAAEGQRVASVAAEVRGLGHPPGPLVVWGLEPGLYPATGRLSAGRYLYLYPLTTPGYSTDSQVASELARWQADPPEIVIDAGSLAPGTPGAPPLLIDRPIDFDGRTLDLLDPLRAFIRDNYRLARVIEGWPVYVRSP